MLRMSMYIKNDIIKMTKIRGSTNCPCNYEYIQTPPHLFNLQNNNMQFWRFTSSCHSFLRLSLVFLTEYEPQHRWQGDLECHLRRQTWTSCLCQATVWPDLSSPCRVSLSETQIHWGQVIDNCQHKAGLMIKYPLPTSYRQRWCLASCRHHRMPCIYFLFITNVFTLQLHKHMEDF